jgi:hypothetical protein
MAAEDHQQKKTADIPTKTTEVVHSHLVCKPAQRQQHRQV